MGDAGDDASDTSRIDHLQANSTQIQFCRETVRSVWSHSQSNLGTSSLSLYTADERLKWREMLSKESIPWSCPREGITWQPRIGTYSNHERGNQMFIWLGLWIEVFSIWFLIALVLGIIWGKALKKM